MHKTPKRLTSAQIKSKYYIRIHFSHVKSWDILRGCRNLVEIAFSFNQIRELDKAIFEQCDNLEVIDFSSNKIKDLDLDIFRESK